KFPLRRFRGEEGARLADVEGEVFFCRDDERARRLAGAASDPVDCLAQETPRHLSVHARRLAMWLHVEHRPPRADQLPNGAPIRTEALGTTHRVPSSAQPTVR